MPVGLRSGIALACLLLGATAASAATLDDAGSLPARPELPADAPAAAACAPPCGYISPIIDLVFPEKPACGAGQAVLADGTPDDCLLLMERGGSVTLDGTLRWYWEISEEGTYPNDPQQDIEISFGGTQSNPDWLEVDVEPGGFTIDTVALFDANENWRVDDSGAEPRVWYWFERNITVTFTRTGDPSDDDLRLIEDRGGVRSVFVKAKSTASGDRYKESFGVEEFRFDATAEPGLDALRDEEAPGLPLVLGIAALAACAAAARSVRRR